MKIKPLLKKAKSKLTHDPLLIAVIVLVLLLVVSLTLNALQIKKRNDQEQAFSFREVPVEGITTMQLTTLDEGIGNPASESGRIAIAYTLKSEDGTIIKQEGYERPFIVNPILYHEFPALHQAIKEVKLEQKLQVTIPADEDYFGQTAVDLEKNDYFVLDITVRDIYY